MVTKIINFRNGEDIIKFFQTSNRTNFHVDTENAEVTEIEISGEEAMLIEKDGMTSLIWHNEEMTFYLQTRVSIDEIVLIAKSLEKKELKCNIYSRSLVIYSEGR